MPLEGRQTFLSVITGKIKLVEEFQSLGIECHKSGEFQAVLASTQVQPSWVDLAKAEQLSDPELIKIHGRVQKGELLDFSIGVDEALRY